MATITKKYTDADYTTPYASGIAHLLPITLPFVEDLKRGEYGFSVEDAEYRLDEYTWEKLMYNSIGREYRQPQKGWKLVLVSGEDTFNLIGEFGLEATSKTEMIRMVNDKIKDSLYSSPERSKHEQYEYKDFVKDFEGRSDAEKVAILQKQIKAMSNGTPQYDALAEAYGYEADNGSFGSVYYPWSYKDEVRSKRTRIIIPSV